LNAAMKYERRVAILGRSMLNFATIARELGYMSFPDGLLIPVDQVRDFPDDQVVILTTGSQGEPMSALTRIANDETQTNSYPTRRYCNYFGNADSWERTFRRQHDQCNCSFAEPM